MEPYSCITFQFFRVCSLNNTFGPTHQVSVMDQDGTGKGLVSLRNVAAERYWGTRWKREWQAKYHDPLVVSFSS